VVEGPGSRRGQTVDGADRSPQALERPAPARHELHGAALPGQDRRRAWLTVVTTGPGKEGFLGQHLVAMRTRDRGRTWTDPVDVEPADGPEASYAVPLKVPGGRIYIFYNHNTDNVREVIGDPAFHKDGMEKRVDSQGYFVFRYSEDGGRTWSPKRYNVPVREFEIDRENPYGGRIRFGWNVGKPFVREGAAYVPFDKVGGFGEGFFTRTEGVLIRSDNILTERDPEKIRWETLPDGNVGLRAPAGGGPIAEEHTYVVLGEGSIYAMYRTAAGRPATSISRDGGRTWSPPRFETFADGRPIRNPRAFNPVWKCSNGRYLYWFHDNGWNGTTSARAPGAGTSPGSAVASSATAGSRGRSPRSCCTATTSSRAELLRPHRGGRAVLPDRGPEDGGPRSRARS